MSGDEEMPADRRTSGKILCESKGRGRSCVSSVASLGGLASQRGSKPLGLKGVSGDIAGSVCVWGGGGYIGQ